MSLSRLLINFFCIFISVYCWLYPHVIIFLSLRLFNRLSASNFEARHLIRFIAVFWQSQLSLCVSMSWSCVLCAWTYRCTKLEHKKSCWNGCHSCLSINWSVEFGAAKLNTYNLVVFFVVFRAYAKVKKFRVCYVINNKLSQQPIYISTSVGGESNTNWHQFASCCRLYFHVWSGCLQHYIRLHFDVCPWIKRKLISWLFFTHFLSFLLPFLFVFLCTQSMN